MKAIPPVFDKVKLAVYVCENAYFNSRNLICPLFEQSEKCANSKFGIIQKSGFVNFYFLTPIF